MASLSTNASFARSHGDDYVQILTYFSLAEEPLYSATGRPRLCVGSTLYPCGASGPFPLCICVVRSCDPSLGGVLVFLPARIHTLTCTTDTHTQAYM